MNATVAVGTALLATLLVVALGWAWWRHRAHIHEMQRRLAWNEESRFELERQTQALDQRLASMAQTLKALESSHSRDSAPRAATAAAAANPVFWKDTEPMQGRATAQHFAETMPAELADYEAAARPAAGTPASFKP